MSEDGAGNPKPEGKMEMVRRLIKERKTYREIAKLIYGEQTEHGQARVRAIVSKLRRSVNLSSSKGVVTERRGTKKGAERVKRPELKESPQPSCDGEGVAQLSSQPAWASPEGYDGVVKAPLAGFGSRVGWVLERDVVTGVICNSVAAGAVKKLASRYTRARFYLCYLGNVTFMAKGDVVSASDPDGDLGKAAGALRSILAETGVEAAEIDRVASKLHHPGEISLDELTVVIEDVSAISSIRRCEPYIPEPGHGIYAIHSPSPVIPGLKVYLEDDSHLRLELMAHNVAQAYNAFFMRAEFVGDVFPHLASSPGVFDEWRSQYWHPYSHPIVINLDVVARSPLRVLNNRESSLAETGTSFDSLPLDLREAIKNLRDNGLLYYNDFRMILSERAKQSNRRDPSELIKQLEFADPLEKEIALILLQKVVIDYNFLLDHLRKQTSKGGID